jgi:hypothetical protein
MIIDGVHNSVHTSNERTRDEQGRRLVVRNCYRAPEAERRFESAAVSISTGRIGIS